MHSFLLVFRESSYFEEGCHKLDLARLYLPHSRKVAVVTNFLYKWDNPSSNLSKTEAVCSVS